MWKSVYKIQCICIIPIINRVFEKDFFFIDEVRRQKSNTHFAVNGSGGDGVSSSFSKTLSETLLTDDDLRFIALCVRTHATYIFIHQIA